MPSMQLEGIRVVAIDFAINKDFKNEEPAGGLNLDLSTRNSFKEDSRTSIVEVCAAVSPEKNTANNVPFFFNVTMQGAFTFAEGFDRNALERFQNINCPAIIFPYLRETVSDIVRRAGFPPLYLPVVNFVKFGQKTEGKQGCDPESHPFEKQHHKG